MSPLYNNSGMVAMDSIALDYLYTQKRQDSFIMKALPTFPDGTETIVFLQYIDISLEGWAINKFTPLEVGFRYKSEGGSCAVWLLNLLCDCHVFAPYTQT